MRKRQSQNNVPFRSIIVQPSIAVTSPATAILASTTIPPIPSSSPVPAIPESPVSAAITTTSTTASTTAITSTTATAARTIPRGALLAGSGDVDGHGAASEVLAMEHLNGLRGLLRRAELHEGEATGAAGHLVQHQIDAHHGTRRPELVLDIAL